MEGAGRLRDLGPPHACAANPQSHQLLPRPALGVEEAAGGGELAVAKAVETLLRELTPLDRRCPIPCATMAA